VEHGNDLRRIGQVVRSLRHEIGLSQEKFAELAQVHRNYVGSLERGEKNISYSTLARIADAGGISVAELMGRAKV
jgi:transcriptional regulator with XRE-family HTH domain